jgi:hypothetical protein
VLLIDNECHKPTLAGRLKRVAAAMGLLNHEWQPNVDTLCLRGQLLSIISLGRILREIPHGKYRLIVLDAAYRFYPQGHDENSNADCAAFYNLIDQYAEMTGAAFILIHHQTKGRQDNKSTVDIGAGAGAGARAADTHIVMREHVDDGRFVLEGVCRSFPPPLPIVVGFEYPLWKRDIYADPTLIKRPNVGGRPPKPKAQKPAKREWTAEDFAAEFTTAEPKARGLIIARAVEAKVPERLAGQLLTLAEDRGLVYRHKATGGNGTLYGNRPPDLCDVSRARTPPRTPPVRAAKKRRLTGN